MIEVFENDRGRILALLALIQSGLIPDSYGRVWTFYFMDYRRN